ncbi:hypothetical protein BC938DRAFT_478322 [Jimgerdemannia flammicorona]|uniref:Homeobox domain-containing protein n=1 Tax=Jimgerdemannia flammicorona TaxID=994334 RepID=A0A433QN11_9FUNG|nr:hypothetical protein BC938DRAFT_478322 [Jimgerdemannia flammicorona]
MTTRTVPIWFQNRRKNIRKKTQIEREDMSRGILYNSLLGSYSNGNIAIRDSKLDMGMSGKSDIAETANAIEFADDFEGAEPVTRPNQN